jgi:Rad3-related DNA helicase
VLYEEEKKFIEPQIRALLRNYIGIKAFDHNYKANLRSISASSLASACKFNPEFLKALNEIQKFTKCKKLNQFIEEAKSFCSETKATI